MPKRGDLMDMSPQEYQAYIKGKGAEVAHRQNTALAFLIGGAICGTRSAHSGRLRVPRARQGRRGYRPPSRLSFLAALTAGLNLYNSLARFAGQEHARADHGLCQLRRLARHRLQGRGIITGMAAKVFVIAGPGDRVWHACERGVRRGADADGIGKSAAGPPRRRAARYSIMLPSNQTTEDGTMYETVRSTWDLRTRARGSLRSIYVQPPRPDRGRERHGQDHHDESDGRKLFRRGRAGVLVRR